MAITINWGNKIINVQKVDMAVVQMMPTEIRELDLNTFRLALKNLEESSNGMAFERTHNHNTIVTVGGVTLSRVIEIINDYTVTFEDGQYAVNLVGANSNVADVVNVNQVSVRSGNSAGLVEAGTSLTVGESTILKELWRLAGLDNSNPLVVDPTSRTIGADINQTIVKDSGTDTVTVTRSGTDPVPPGV